MSKLQPFIDPNKTGLLDEGIPVEQSVQISMTVIVDDKIIELAKRITMLNGSINSIKKFVKERVKHLMDLENDLVKAVDELKSIAKEPPQ